MHGFAVTATSDALDVPKRPLVVRFGAMGDMVIVLALIHSLHRRFGVPVDVVSSGSATRPLLEGQPGVGSLYLVRSRKAPYLLNPGQWQLVRALRARGPAPTWTCESDDKSHWLLAHAGIPPSLIVSARSFPRLPGEHVVDHWLRLARESPAALRGEAAQSIDDRALRSPPLRTFESWRTELDAWLDSQGLAQRPLVLVQIGNRRVTTWGRRQRRATNTKYWPEESWARVVDAIAHLHPDAEILLTGVSAEFGLNESIVRRATTNRVRNVAGDLPLPRLLALQERAIGMVSVDTGPAHSAAALGCPLVVLFGIADPVKFSPRSPTGAVVSLQGHEGGRASMLAISVDEVINAWKSLHQSSVRSDRYRGAETPVAMG
jgi:ADP-heptose:LPS heptosyltransferase